ncbi:peroxiredoxin [Oleiagrimonas sp. C23AA]|uniref:peroxiredoxin n=1 Tax=Oleiagrimonas sp. C23AA TaxID=2719047 RepID=UPI00141E9CA3|nr:peroxiredoxin [Oleiagrimonas sp. C23AA]NII10511.1 peroxiredoxin [Oleiagrimonas sp. C23AA]
MTIQIGQALPAAQFNRVGDDIQCTDTQAVFAGKKVVLFAVPGAFTPTCSSKHLPGYIKAMPAFRERGIEVVCLAVNDAFVLKAWAASQQAPDDLIMLADGNAEFTRALGLEMDGTGFGMGVRARRFALYADNGIVKALNVEAPGEFRVSAAEAMLATLDAL